ncbi:hypothetical protein [Vibrio parahaemolyticus]|uniref:hypothetical protein n=1 Tax=Vibrio parahaemolyticus TaxID=670 RepID=UPI0024906E58|nr:hypothetical protein [Vibrio parahaemolyticus]
MAKNIENINDYFKFDFAMTFSLSRLFYASLCFAIATLIYQLRCPLIIKDNLNYHYFFECGKNSQHVLNYYIECVNRVFSNISKESIDDLCSKFDKSADLKVKELVTNKEKSFFIDNNLRDKFFWSVFDTLNEKFRFSSFICISFYCLGIFFLVITAVGNVIYALKLFFPNVLFLEWMFNLIS